MKTVRKGLLVFAAVLALNASGASAQVAWDSPFLMPPRPTPGLGVFLMDVAGGDIGAMFTWQPTARSLGFRLGIAEQRDDDIAIFGGADVSGAITRATRDFPLDVDWVFGIGGSIGDDFLLSVPAGISLGHTFPAEGARFTPYLTPRVVLDAWFGDDAPGDDDDVSLDLAVDIGLDLQFQGNWKIRFGGTIGDRDAVAIGIVF